MNTLDEQPVIGIPIIYHDHHLIAVNKPAGLVIHPTYKHADGTMWDILLEALARQGSDGWQPPTLPDRPGWERAPAPIREMLREQQRLNYIQKEGWLSRPCLLHRLDKDTSGVVVLARTEGARRHLSRQFQQHAVVKRYLAVVGKGAPDWAVGRKLLKVSRRCSEGQEIEVDASSLLDSGDEYMLDGALKLDPENRRRCIVDPLGQRAITMVKLLAVNDTYGLLEARPVTGRTHQIRAHLASAGFAIAGDATYGLNTGEGAPESRLHRQFLHAYCLELHRYPDNRLCSYVAPLAAELEVWLTSYFPEGLEVINNSVICWL